MNNLIIAKNYETFGDAGLTSNKVIYYKEDNMVKFRANITDDPFGESEVVTVGGVSGLEKVFLGESTHWDVPAYYSSIPNRILYYNSNIESVNSDVTSIETYAFSNSTISRFNSEEEGTLDLSNITTLGSYSFYICPNVTKAILSENLVTIEMRALSGTGIENIDIPNSVTRIDGSAFRDLTLKIMNFGNTRTTIPAISSTTFQDSISEDTKFVVPDALYDNWKVASVWKNTGIVEHIYKYSDVFPVYYDYLEGDGLAYIDTGYKIDYYNTIKTKLNVIEATTQNRMAVMGWYNVNYDSVTSNLSFNNSRVNNRWFNRILQVTGMRINTIYEFTFNKDGYKGDINIPFEEELDVPSNTTLKGNLTLVRLSTISDAYSKGKVKLYYTQIFNKEEKLIMDFRPCYYQGETGLWELVENKFYGNANSTGTLTVGND